MSKVFKISFDDNDHKTICEEASSRLLKPTEFIRLCIASYVNKGSQRRVFQKSESTNDKEKKSSRDPK